MRRVFADTFYWIALLNPRDQGHHEAVSVSKGLGASRITTTEEVLTELLNFFAPRRPFLRGAATTLVERMQADSMITIAPQSHDGFLAGLRLYEARSDKGYSLTDCISMVVMRREGLNEVLSNDKHFSQEGFTSLLGS